MYVMLRLCRMSCCVLMPPHFLPLPSTTFPPLPTLMLFLVHKQPRQLSLLNLSTITKPLHLSPVS
jgi:hypothetical protein